MAYRYCRLAGASALIYLLYQLGEMLTASDEGTPWPIVLGAALVLSIAITWTALANRVSTWLVVVADAVAAAAAVTWTAAPGTTRGLLPTAETMTALHTEVSRAIDALRSGVDPIFPFPGLLALLLVLFWIIGFIFAWGLFRGRPYIALLPPLVIALQFATIDRDPATRQGSAVFLSIVAACLLAIAVDRRRQGTAQMAAAGEFGATRRKLPRASTGLVAFTVVASIGVGSAFGGLVPADGLVNWRSPPGPGEGGPTAYNAFISIRQRLVSVSDTPVFTAHIRGEVPIDQIYFSLTTMENYDGEQFSPSPEEAARLDDEAWLAPEQQFVGPVERVITDVEIRQLSMRWLPSVATPVGFATDDRTLRGSIGISPDGSLQIRGGLTTAGMSYRVTSDVPRPDMAALARSGATLSPVFREAEKAGEKVPEQSPVSVRPEPLDDGHYLGLPADLDRRIERLAHLETRNLTTSFEKAIALETWFRDEFEYSTNIEPGHGATDLAAWLLDSASPNYRAGYCENFAVSMAVMARTLGIPSRVVLGFTPGVPQADGSVVVLDRNAHAWVELWMPTQGWVRFDPTPRRDQVNPPTIEAVETWLGFTLRDYLDVADPVGAGTTVAPATTATVPSTTLPPDREGAAAGGFEIAGWVPAFLWATVAALALGGIPALKWLRRRRRRRRLRTGDISAAWDEIVIRLDDLGTPPDAADTPHEVASKVDPAMVPLATVYARSLYGEAAVLPPELVTAATSSLTSTEQILAERHSRTERMLAGFRIRTLLPRWWQRHHP
jgi:transglutaminase-like putative cysteine protease